MGLPAVGGPAGGGQPQMDISRFGFRRGDDGTVTYEVKRGDSYWRIAANAKKAFPELAHMSTRELAELLDTMNKHTVGRVINPGEVIKLPVLTPREQARATLDAVGHAARIVLGEDAPDTGERATAPQAGARTARRALPPEAQAHLDRLGAIPRRDIGNPFEGMSPAGEPTSTAQPPQAAPSETTPEPNVTHMDFGDEEAGEVVLNPNGRETADGLTLPQREAALRDPTPLFQGETFDLSQIPPEAPMSGPSLTAPTTYHREPSGIPRDLFSGREVGRASKSTYTDSLANLERQSPGIRAEFEEIIRDILPQPRPVDRRDPSPVRLASGMQVRFWIDESTGKVENVTVEGDIYILSPGNRRESLKEIAQGNPLSQIRGLEGVTPQHVDQINERIAQMLARRFVDG
jgi:hypothetical protein